MRTAAQLATSSIHTLPELSPCYTHILVHTRPHHRPDQFQKAASQTRAGPAWQPGARQRVRERCGAAVGHGEAQMQRAAQRFGTVQVRVTYRVGDNRIRLPPAPLTLTYLFQKAAHIYSTWAIVLTDLHCITYTNQMAATLHNVINVPSISELRCSPGHLPCTQHERLVHMQEPA